MPNPCKKEKEELEDAKKQLGDHRSNPLGWDIESEEYQKILAELLEKVAEKQKALEECEADSK
jgi:hypothetical protein